MRLARQFVDKVLVPHSSYTVEVLINVRQKDFKFVSQDTTLDQGIITCFWVVFYFPRCLVRPIKAVWLEVKNVGSCVHSFPKSILTHIASDLCNNVPQEIMRRDACEK